MTDHATAFSLLRCTYTNSPRYGGLFTFKDPEKIPALARRGEAWGSSETRQMLEHEIETGRGGCYLRLTPGQYRKIRRT
jgi:hypothetical protein